MKSRFFLVKMVRRAKICINFKGKSYLSKKKLSKTWVRAVCKTLEGGSGGTAKVSSEGQF